MIANFPNLDNPKQANNDSRKDLMGVTPTRLDHRVTFFDNDTSIWDHYICISKPQLNFMISDRFAKNNDVKTRNNTNNAKRIKHKIYTKQNVPSSVL